MKQDYLLFLRRRFNRLLIVLMMMWGTTAVAQNITVSGTVKDETGAGMPGVNVVIKGTQNGTVTDANGAFAIAVSPNAVLVFSFIGYKTLEEPINARTNISVSMQNDLVNLEEVVVTGYASERRQDIVSAVSTLSSSNTIAIPVSNVEQAAQVDQRTQLLQGDGLLQPVVDIFRDQEQLRGYIGLPRHVYRSAKIDDDRVFIG